MAGAADKARALANSIKDIKDKKVAVTVTYGATWSAKTAALVSAINTANKGHVLGFASGGAVPGTGYGDTQPAMLTPGEFVVRRDGSNIADALKHFGAKATSAAGIDYDRLASAMSRAHVNSYLDGANVTASVDRRVGAALR